MSAGLAGEVTLISAPAGSGKTSLLGEWAADCPRPVAWLPLDERLAALLDHLPPMHLVVATRADPPWSLARLRARGQLTELRQPEQRFTLEETTTFLDRVMGVSLPAEGGKSCLVFPS